jgi:hypothetical protein
VTTSNGWRGGHDIKLLEYRWMESQMSDFKASLEMDVDLKEELGVALTATELGRLLKLDRRTVVKYADRWGGVEVCPGTYRFFEKRILEVINGASASKACEEAVCRISDGQRQAGGKVVSRREQKESAGRRDMGGEKARRNGSANPDPHGIFNNPTVAQ